MQSLCWYDNIPLISFCLLRGKCRSCLVPISFLYPFIELITVASFLGLFYYIDSSYWFAYGIFFSALIVTIRTDLETMLISRYVTLFLVPVGWGLSYCNLLPISLMSSFLASIFGFGFLYAISYIFLKLTGKEGMGQGDVELLAFIGAFLGPIGCWISLMIATILGTVLGISYLLITKQSKGTGIPFGPFLAFGALFYTLFKDLFFLF